MKIGIMSDSHDNMPKIAAAVKCFNEAGVEHVVHAGDFAAQARRAFENAGAVLTSAGAAWRDVVKVTIFLRDIARDYAAFNAAREDFFRDAGIETYPASTCIEARLCREDLLVEMEMLAVVADGRRRS